MREIDAPATFSPRSSDRRRSCVCRPRRGLAPRRGRSHGRGRYVAARLVRRRRRISRGTRRACASPERLGERGAIQLHGRRGSLDSASPGRRRPPSAAEPPTWISISPTTRASTRRLAMRAFYSSGDLEVGRSARDRSGVEVRQSQRSWGYDARWRKQIDGASRVALQVGLPRRQPRARRGERRWVVSPSRPMRRTGRSAPRGRTRTSSATGTSSASGARAQRL